MNYRLTSWLDADAFSLSVIEVYADPDGYFSSATHI